MSDMIEIDAIKALSTITRLEDERAALRTERDELKNNIIKELTAERDALREALKPFAKEAEGWNASYKDEDHPACDAFGCSCDHCGKDPKYQIAAFTVGDLRRARAALK